MYHDIYRTFEAAPLIFTADWTSKPGDIDYPVFATEKGYRMAIRPRLW